MDCLWLLLQQKLCDLQYLKYLLCSSLQKKVVNPWTTTISKIISFFPRLPTEFQMGRNLELSWWLGHELLLFCYYTGILVCSNLLCIHCRLLLCLPLTSGPLPFTLNPTYESLWAKEWDNQAFQNQCLDSKRSRGRTCRAAQWVKYRRFLCGKKWDIHLSSSVALQVDPRLFRLAEIVCWVVGSG